MLWVERWLINIWSVLLCILSWGSWGQHANQETSKATYLITGIFFSIGDAVSCSQSHAGFSGQLIPSIRPFESTSTQFIKGTIISAYDNTQSGSCFSFHIDLLCDLGQDTWFQRASVSPHSKAEVEAPFALCRQGIRGSLPFLLLTASGKKCKNQNVRNLKDMTF